MAAHLRLFRVAVRNIGRNPFRLVATVLAIAVCMFTFVLVRTVVWSLTVAADRAPQSRIVTRNKVSFVTPLPRRYVDDIGEHARDLHVTRWTHATWFGGKEPLHPDESFASVAVDARTYFDVYDEASVPPDELRRWQEDRQGAIVGAVLAKRMGWKVGDRVRLESSVFPERSPWELTIDGVYDSRANNIDRSWFVLHWSYVNDVLGPGRRDKVGWISSSVDDPSRAPEASAAIDRMFEERELATLSQDERTFYRAVLAMMSAVLSILDVVSWMLLVISLLVVGNTIGMAVRERTREYGVLLAMGFMPRRIIGGVVVEAVLLSGIGGVLGLGLARLLVDLALGRWIEENFAQFFRWFRVDPWILVMAFVSSLAFGVLASALPAWSLARMKAIDALRRIG